MKREFVARVAMLALLFLSAAPAVWGASGEIGPFLVNSTSSSFPAGSGGREFQGLPSITTLPNGNIVIGFHMYAFNPALQEYNGYRVFDPSGVPITNEFNNTADYTSSSTFYHFQPIVMGLDNTHFLSVYFVEDSNGDGTKINGRVLTWSGNTISQGPESTLLTDSASSDNRDLRCAALGTNNFVLTFGHNVLASPGGATTSAFVEALTFHGDPAGAGTLTVLTGAKQIGQHTAVGLNPPSVATNGTQVSVAWSQNLSGGGTNVYGYQFAVDGTGHIPALVLGDVVLDTGLNFFQNLAVLSSGNILVMYTTGSQTLIGKIYGSGFTGSPAPIQINTQVNAFTPALARAQALLGGGFIIAWSSPVSNSETDIHARLYDSSSTPRTDEFAAQAIANTDIFDLQIVRRPGAGGFALTWGQTVHAVNNEDIYAAIFTNIGPTSSGTPANLAAINEDDANPPGASLTSLVGSAANFDDQDGQAFAGVAVRGNAATAGQGTWQFFSGGVWNTIATSVSDNSAMIMAPTTLVRFLPAANVNGTPPSLGTLSVRLWDGTGGFSTGTSGVNISNSIFNVTTSTTATNTLGNPFSGATNAVGQPITAVNDAPTIATGSVTLTAINEDTVNPAGQTVAAVATAAFSDALDNQTANGGSAANTLAGMAITANAETTQGNWQYFNGASFVNIGTAVSDSGAFVVAQGTMIRFLPALNFNGSAPLLTARLIDNSSGTVANGGGVNVSANGGKTQYSSGTFTIGETINPVNDAPTITGLDNAPTYTENAAALVLDNNAVIADVELDAANNYSGATLTLARHGGASAQDVFGTVGTLAFSGGNVQIGGTTVGTFTNSGGTLVITFNAAATTANVNAVLNQLTYANNSDAPPASAQIDFTINDGNTGAQGSGGALSATGSITVTIIAVNDAPVATVPGAAYSATEQFALSLKNTGLSVSDVDGLSGSETATLSVVEGTLTVTAGSSGATVSGSGTSSVTINGTIAQINALLNTDGTSAVSYIDNTDTPSASTQLTLAINDNGNTGTGGPLTDSKQATINITAVNDAPVATITAAAYAATEQVSLNLKNTGISVSDPDALGGSESATLSVVEGTLTVTAGGSGATVGGSGTSSVAINGSIAQINALLNTDATSTVSYIDNTDTPSASTSLTLQVNDNGNTGTGGAKTGSKTVPINVAAVNDAPTLTVPASLTATAGTGIRVNGITFTDVDGGVGLELATFIVTNGSLTAATGGGVTVGGTTTSRTLSGTIANLNAFIAGNSLTYTAAAQTSDTLTVIINDQGNTGGGALSAQKTVPVTVNAALSIAPASLAGAFVGITTNQTITISNGTKPYTTFNFGTFNGGTTGLTAAALATNSAAGTVTLNGTPTGTGSATFTVNVTDTAGATLAQPYTLVVNPDPKITATLKATQTSVSPGGQIDYTAIVKNIDVVPNTKNAVQLNIPLDSNTTQTGTTNASPYTIDQTAVAATSGVGKAITLQAIDPDAGDTLTYALTGAGPAHGTLSGFNASTGAVTYTATPGYNGSDNFTFKATDNHAAPSNEDGIVAINVTLPPPIAVADSYQTGKNIALNQGAPGVLANDTTNFATIASYGASSGNEQTTIGSSTPTLKAGTIVLNADGSFLYTPANNFTSSDSFVYKLSNSTSSSTATVTITVIAPPVAVADGGGSIYATPVNGAFGRNTPGVLGNDTLNGATITGYGALTGTEQTAIGSATPTAQGGSVTLNAGGDFSFTPKNGFSGNDTFEYTLTNIAGSSTATATIYVDVLPTVTSTVPANLAAGVGIGTGITINFSETITTTNAFTITDTTSSTNVPFTQSPTDGNTTATFTLNPTSALAGGHTIQVTVLHNQTADSDGGLSMAADYTFSFTTLPPPVAVNDPDTQGGRYQVTGNVAIDTALTATPSSIFDNDGLNSTTSVTYGPTGPNSFFPVDGTTTITTLKGATVLLRVNGTFTYNPGPGYTGFDSFFYDLNNASGSSRAQVLFNVTNSIWFVNKGAPGLSNGTLSDPFKDISALQSVNDGGATHPKTGEMIFVYDNAAAYTGPLTLLNTQKLIGQAAAGTLSSVSGITFAAYSVALPTMGSGTKPTIATDGITLAQNNVLNTLTLTPSTSSGLILGADIGTTGSVTNVDITASGLISAIQSTAAFVGTLNYSTGTIGNTGSSTTITMAGASSGSMTFTNAAIGSTGSGRVFSCSAHTGGTVDFTPGTTTLGCTSSAAVNAVSIQNCSGTTFKLGALNLQPTGAGCTGILVQNGGTVQSTSGTISCSGPALDITNPSGATVLGLTLGSVTSTGGATGINIGSATSGSITTTGGALSGATGAEFNVTGGTCSITYSGNITGRSGQHSVNISGTTGGTIALSGSVTENAAGTGISLSSNTGATINFSGQITASTGANTAFSATGGGTISATNANSTLTTTVATALNVSNTTIGASGLKFKSISAGTGAVGPAKGINLDTTGAFGGLTVSGTGGAGTGGVIQKCNHGVFANSTINLSLSSMTIQNNGLNQTAAGSSSTVGGDLITGNNLSAVANITLFSVTNASLTGVTVTGSSQMGINGNGVNGLTIANCTVTGNGNESFEDGIILQNTSGTLSITGTNVRDNRAREMHIANGSGTMTLTASNSQFGHTNAGTGTAESQQGILMQLYGTSNTTINATTLTISNNEGIGFTANGLQINADNGGPNVNGSITSSVFDNNAAHVFVNAGGTSAVTFDTKNNLTMTKAALQSINYTVLGGSTAITANLQGTISGNVINDSALPNANADAIDINSGSTWAGQAHIRIDGNNIQGVSGGIIATLDGSTAGGTTPRVDLRVVNNNLSNPVAASAAEAIKLNAAVTSTHPNLIVGWDVGGAGVSNNISGHWANGASEASIFLRNRFTAASSIILPGYGGAAGDDAAVTTYLTGRNSIIPPGGTGVSGLVTHSNTNPFTNGTVTTPLLFKAGGVESNGPVRGTPKLQQFQLDGLVSAASVHWESTGLTDAQHTTISSLKFEVAHLSDGRLGEAGPGVIRIDAFAGGNGWFIDPAPDSDTHFPTLKAATRRYTTSNDPAAGRIDLLTALMHEMGHALGLPDTYDPKDRDSIMYGFLTKGERRLPAKGEAERIGKRVESKR